MAVDEQEFKKLRRRAQAAQQARDKAEGQLEAAMERLHDEFGCDTVKAAEAMAKDLKREAEAAEAAYDEAAASFEEAWEAQLADED